MKTYLKLFLLIFTLSFMGCGSNDDSDGESSILQLRGDDDFKCETAFAYCEEESICFADDVFGFKRWGWKIGPLSQPLKDECIIYAGAAKCDTDRGVAVGYYEITYENDSVEIHYHAYEGYLFTEAHLYVGNAMYPTLPNGKPTVAPGQYPYHGSISEPTDLVVFELDEEFTGEIYVIAHSVVCAE